jgi:SAM-dependent methyltransferase
MIKEKALENFKDNVYDQSFNDGDLGGCNVDGDPGSECPMMWKYVVDKYDIKSVLDVGCGFGYHLKYFKDFLNLKVMGIEGSQKVASISLLPNDIKCHDYTTGELLIDSFNFDLCWSVEFVEHVDASYIDNFLCTFTSCKYLIMTHATAGQGGHHHVNEQGSDYWKKELARYNLEYDETETQNIRDLAMKDFNNFREWQSIPKDIRPKRGIASEVNCDVGYLIPHVAEHAMFFKNKNLI